MRQKEKPIVARAAPRRTQIRQQYPKWRGFWHTTRPC